VMEYVGIIRIVGVRMETPVFDVDDERSLKLLIDVAMKIGTGQKVYKDLMMSVREYGDFPTVGEMMFVAIKGTKIMLID